MTSHSGETESRLSGPSASIASLCGLWPRLSAPASRARAAVSIGAAIVDHDDFLTHQTGSRDFPNDITYRFLLIQGVE